MGILARYTLRSLARNRARTLATVCGIALSCALVTAILTTVTSMGTGLLQRTLETEGAWQVTSPMASDESVAVAVGNPHVTNLVCSRELGSARLPEDLASTMGSLLTVKTLPVALKGATDVPALNGTTAAVALLPETTMGRLPETPDEVLLPSSLQNTSPAGGGIASEGPIAVGTRVTLSLGTRVLDRTGQRLSSMDYYDELDGTPSETLADVTERTLTVTGFYDPQGGIWYGGEFTSSSSGRVAITGPAAEGETAGFALPYLTTDLTTYADLVTLANDLFHTDGPSAASDGGSSDSGYVLHDTLLRYQGLVDDRAVWLTLGTMAAVCVGVVVVAGVSLIRTSFAISVTERTRQFGLLAGVGASRQQLRRSVLAEALVLGVVGIPLGLALGVAGTAVTLSLTQAGFAALLDTQTGIELAVDPRVLATSAALAVATLLVSAWVPAARAARGSAVEAIRQGREVRERLGRSSGRHARRHSGRLAQRLCGVGGLVAHRNLTRSAARGRVVVASLAVSCMLVVTCGVVDAYLRPLAGVAGDGGSADADVGAFANATARDLEGDPPTFFRRVAAFREQARALDGVTPLRSALSGSVEVTMPSGLLSEDALLWLGAEAQDEAGGENAMSVRADGAFSGTAWVTYVDDATWRSLGMGEPDAGHPQAIGLNVFNGTNGIHYGAFAPFEGTGMIEVRASGETSAGSPAQVEVAKTLEDLPAGLAGVVVTARLPVLLMPEALLASDGNSQTPFVATSMEARFEAQDSAQATKELSEVASTAFRDDAGGLSVHVADLATQRQSNIDLAGMVTLFVALFSVITMLIALANVFNTLTSSIALRTREFAVLRSVGMGDRAFARMLAYECASYAWRGLAIGLALAAVVSLLLWYSMDLSFAGIAFAFPLPYVAAAVAGTLVVLALSVAYALHKSHAENLVEALRRDAL